MTLTRKLRCLQWIAIAASLIGVAEILVWGDLVPWIATGGCLIAALGSCICARIAERIEREGDVL